jgi:hypothetical protein
MTTNDKPCICSDPENCVEVPPGYELRCKRLNPPTNDKPNAGECERLAKHETCDHDYDCTYEGMDGERYRCKKCGDSYFLDYEEMR